jgi:pyridoxal 5'-phosphate synthase pdxT subunit
LCQLRSYFCHSEFAPATEESPIDQNLGRERFLGTQRASEWQNNLRIQYGSAVARLGVDYVFVRTPRDLEGVDAVILPGGESTTQWKFLVEEGLDKSLLAHAAKGGAIFGTCAGAILLAKEVLNPSQPSLGLADITVVRNGYGRQLASEVRHGATYISPEPIELVFIRAPIIERIGPGVMVLAKSEGQTILIRQGNILIATFHPELTSNTSVHEYFLRMARDRDGVHNQSSAVAAKLSAAPVEPQ